MKTLLAIIFISCHTLSSLSQRLTDHYCAEEPYGKPTLQHCHRVSQFLPHGGDNEARGADRIRLFSEPQFSRAPFSGVHNRYHPSAVISIPKMWSSGES